MESISIHLYHSSYGKLILTHICDQRSRRMLGFLLIKMLSAYKPAKDAQADLNLGRLRAFFELRNVDRKEVN